MTTDVGQRLWRLRSGLGLTQRAFAARFAIPYGVVADVEQGRVQPVRSLCVLLAAIEDSPDVIARAAAQPW